jgi:hypothetical protein
MELMGIARNLTTARQLIFIGFNLGVGLTVGYLVVAFVGGLLTYFTTPKVNASDVDALFQEMLKKKEEKENKGE